MNLTNFLVRLSLVTFITIGAWNQLQNVDTTTEQFLESYKTFQNTFTSRTNLNFHQTISHQNLTKHGKCITKGLSYVLLALGAASLLICQGFTFLLGLVYFLQQVVVMNFAKFDQNSSLDEFRELSLCLLIIFVCCMASCGKGNGSCKVASSCGVKKNCNKGNTTAKKNVKSRKRRN